MERVQICIPLPSEQASGLRTDVHEHVTINGKTTLIKRGEYVAVPIDIYIQLRNRYPNL